MKTLLLIRHAKSSWADLGQPDIDRPLNDRGKKDAPVMAKRLLDRKLAIDVFLSSPAKRAKKTGKIFCEVFEKDTDKLQIDEELYEAGVQNFYNVIGKLKKSDKVVALFSHNPGITDFANSLCKGIRVDNMPTCSVFAVEADVENWSDLQPGTAKFSFFDYPKKTL